MRNANNLISDLQCLRLDGWNCQNPGLSVGGNLDAKEVDENFLFDMEQDCRVVWTDS